MVQAAQSRACFRRHRACGHRPTCRDCGAVIPGRASGQASCNGWSYPIVAIHCLTVRCGGGSPALSRGCLAASIRTGAITPLLGGVGPMTITRLMHNILIAASKRGVSGFRYFGGRDTLRR
ncbi:MULTISPECIES: hypothetical protein [Rhizobium]|uniref:hypothetical protein n=1 Tax=Rhizobium TaxID=379 RepID=UPI001612ABF2|nr:MULTISPECIES: hypothetical protein [Rhizobium]